MKKLIAIIAVVLLSCSLSACEQEGYEAGYEAGYSDGYSDAEIEMEYLLDEEFLDGYDWGYDDGYWEAEKEYGKYRWLEEDAMHYAREQTGWDLESACMLIEAYQNNEPFYVDGSCPSEKDYLDAIETLICFYDYFFSKMYE